MTQSVSVVHPSPGTGDDEVFAKPPRLRDVIWLTWRQQGVALLLTALATVVMTVLLLVAWSHFDALPCKGSRQLLSVSGQESLCDLSLQHHYTLLDRSSLLLRIMVIGLPLVVAVFWGAPVVAREYEQGTQGLAWGQAVSARQWLLARVAVLATFAVALCLPVWLCARLLAESLSRSALIYVFRGSRFEPLPFSVLAPMVVPYTLLALSIGVLCSVLLRRTLPAIALAAALCIGLGVLTVNEMRPHYLPARTAHAAASKFDVPVGPNPLFLVNNTWADAQGQPTRGFPSECDPTDVSCLNQHGIYGRVSVYQPGSREAGFQWIEAALAMLLAAGCLTIAVWRVRPR